MGEWRMGTTINDKEFPHNLVRILVEGQKLRQAWKEVEWFVKEKFPGQDEISKKTCARATSTGKRVSNKVRSELFQLERALSIHHYPIESEIARDPIPRLDDVRTLLGPNLSSWGIESLIRSVARKLITQKWINEQCK